MERSGCPVIKLSNIVLAIDNSKHSEAAVREAFGLAQTCSAKIFAVSIVESNPEFEALAPQMVEKMGAAAKKLLDSVTEQAKKENIKCEAIAHTGEDPAQFIVEEAKKRKADMIIMGKHGERSSLTKFFMGSVTARVLSHAPCNVLVIVE
ncbi:MAG: universal stress protein [Nitrospirota bacterium]|nr:universal stress protein [Nitrospirota bacterium]